MANEEFIDKQIRLLLESGLFERHWYMGQCGVYFHNGETAAAHFVREGMSNEASPHPLVEPRMWPDHLREAWRSQNLASVLAWFRRPKLRQAAMGPLVEARYFDGITDAEFASHPGGILGYVLENSTYDGLLPTRYGSIPLKAVKSTWPQLYSRLKLQKRLVGPRHVNQWDAERESTWVAELPAFEVLTTGARVSIVMPTWNRSAVVTTAIRSVQSQNFDDWELIVADDGSTDATVDAVRAMAAADPRIRVLELEHSGVSAARNAALAAATGDYVAFLDSDNQWPVKYLQLMVRGLLHHGARAAYAGLELHNDGKTTYRGFEGGLEHLLVMNHVDLNVLVLERELAVQIEFDESLRRWVDHDFAIRVAQQTELAYFPFIGCIYDDNREMADRITTSESDSWQWAALGKNVISWDGLSESSGREGLVSVVIPIYQDWQLTLRAVQAVLERSGDVEVEVILVDNGSAYFYGSTLSQFFADDSRVRYVRLPRNMNFGIGSNYGAALADGEFICFLNNDTEVREGWLAPLLERLRDPEVRGVQPLLQYPDDSIQTAGTVFVAPRVLPTHFLTGLPPEDAAAVDGMKFHAVTAACVVMRRREIAELKGFDPLYVNGMEDVDLCLRATEKFGGHFAVVPSARVTHYESKTPGRGRAIPENRSTFMQRWRHALPPVDVEKYRQVGFSVGSLGGDRLLITQPRPLIVRERSSAVERWGVRISAIGGARGDRWGDTYYASSLAAARASRGKKVLTYRHGANVETERSYDDVNLVIRGLDRVPPVPDQLNVLWVISHPEDVSVEEIRAFDRVYAASSSWAREMSQRSGSEVRVLLQATDGDIFFPAPRGAEVASRPLTFVGAHFPQRTRKSVADALVSGTDLRIIGHGWRNLPDVVHEAEGVPNHQLGDVYRSASRVLADHWPDMAGMGFIQNRIFDAVACGTPVITDSVTGLGDVFGSLVQEYADVDHLRYLASPSADGVFGSKEEREAQAADILAHHSFGARAEQLIRDSNELQARIQ